MSSPAAAPSTPLRALPSNIALRAAPAVPPAAQAYAPLVKGVLRQRLLSRIFLYSAVFCWTLVAVASAVRQGGAGGLGLFGLLVKPFLPPTLALAGTIWLVGVVPVLVLRKVYLTGAYASESSLLDSELTLCGAWCRRAQRSIVPRENIRRGLEQRKHGPRTCCIRRLRLPPHASPRPHRICIRSTRRK